MKKKKESLITLILYLLCFKKNSGKILNKYEAKKIRMKEIVQGEQTMWPLELVYMGTAIAFR